jgi:membrane peptidoglycan carboxypeptidase
VYNQVTGGSGGGSTITQQYVKVATGQDQYSFFRKFREVIIAAKMTKQNSKDQILQDYLNTIYFGRGAYGIQAASQAYFGKKVQALSPYEGAVLAGAIQAPSLWDPAKNPDQAHARWNYVLDGMVTEGWLSRTDRASAKYPATIPPGSVPGSPTDSRAHVADRVLAELEEHGITREDMATKGGQIVTTIDARAQNVARDAVLKELHGQPANLHSALVAVDPRSGGVLAYYGGEDGNGFDLAGGPAWNPGSAFKPFTMLAALEQGIGIDAVYDGDSPLTVDGTVYHNSESTSYKALTLRDAMTHSVNTTFVQLTNEVGPRAVRDAAFQAGIPQQINGKPALLEPNNAPPALGITLGQYPVHTIDMASAYATFADNGTRHQPFFVREYKDSSGTDEYTHPDRPVQAFDPTDPQRNAQLAGNVTQSMLGVAADSKIPLDGGRQVAAKTGTHQLGDTGNNSAAWTVGYTPSISAAVWVGDPANSALKDKNGNDVFGRGVPGLIWQRFMNNYLDGTPKETFPPVKLISGKPGPAVNEIVPTTENKKVTAPTRTETPTPTPESVPTTTEQPQPTEKPQKQCTLFSCSTPTQDPGTGGGNQPPGGGGGFTGGSTGTGRNRG